MNTLRIPLLLFVLAGQCEQARAQQDELRAQTEVALRKACQFFRNEVSAEGGYLWRYSEDLKYREGEAVAGPGTIWIQPPGTPTVGEAFLTAYRGTGDRRYLEYAKDAAMALVRGQLQSGGWDYRIEFDPADRKRYAYRKEGGTSNGRNTTTLDDNTTQSAIRLLMHVDSALEFKETAIHEAVEYALQSLLAVQYPSGAWPQRFDGPPDPAKFPVLKASYPESWSRTWPELKYSDYYTFNDNALADVMDVMFEASKRYQQPKYQAAAEKAGDFILLAQLPDPQPAWAQQYDARMQPAWARKFEPPSVTGGESIGVMRILLRLYVETGNTKYLEPIPRAIAYLKGSRLNDGRLARFYELRTNKPLYFTKDYVLTYSDADMPTHYGFKVGDGTATVEREYQRLINLDAAQLAAERARRSPVNYAIGPQPKSGGKPGAELVARTKAAIAALDARGRWVEAGELRHQRERLDVTRVIDSSTFAKNVEVLSNYLSATRP